MAKRIELMEKFHQISKQQRLARLKEFCDLTDSEVDALSGENALAPEIAENLVENVIGYFQIPLGVATNFRIDGRDVFIPMAVEETSIIAAASATAKWVRNWGLLTTNAKGRISIGQVQIPHLANIKSAVEKLTAEKNRLIEFCNSTVANLVARGGGVRDLVFRKVPRNDSDGSMLVIHILCDCCDAMGANIINQMCEALKPRIEEITVERVGLCILSNLVDSKLVVAEVRIRDVESEIGQGIEEASVFAESDPYRACTHNKGVLNGIDPILIATGNDWRAVEAGIHAYACRTGTYQPVTKWWVEDKDLVGRFEAPISVGTVGGVTRIHPTARVALKVLGVSSAEGLARVCAAVGLVQNLGALKALSTVGIVKGHMNLHAANLAVAAGAQVHEIGEVSKRLREVLKAEKHINLSHAVEILNRVRATLLSQ